MFKTLLEQLLNCHGGVSPNPLGLSLTTLMSHQGLNFKSPSLEVLPVAAFRLQLEYLRMDSWHYPGDGTIVLEVENHLINVVLNMLLPAGEF